MMSGCYNVKRRFAGRFSKLFMLACCFGKRKIDSFKCNSTFTPFLMGISVKRVEIFQFLRGKKAFKLESSGANLVMV